MSLSIAFASQLVQSSPRTPLGEEDEDDDLLLDDDIDDDDVLLDTSAFADVARLMDTNTKENCLDNGSSPTRVMDFPPPPSSPTTASSSLSSSPVKPTAATDSSSSSAAVRTMMVPRQLLPDLSMAPLVVDTDTVTAATDPTDTTSSSSSCGPVSVDATEPMGQEQQIQQLQPLITPIALPKQRVIQFQPLPHIPESTAATNVIDTLWNSANTAAHTRWSVTTELPKPKLNPATTMTKKPTRLERSSALAEEARHHAATGNEPEAVLLYRRAYKIADAELARLRTLLVHETSKLQTAHPRARPSMQIRVQTDWRDTIRHMAFLQLQRASLLERQGELQKAMEACTQAKGLYKKLRKKTRQLQAANTAANNNNTTAQETRKPDDDVDDDNGDMVASSPPRLGAAPLTPRDTTMPTDKPSIPWHVPCPRVEHDCKLTNQFLDRLT